VQCKEEAPAMHLCNMTPKKQSMLKICVLCKWGIARSGIDYAASAQSIGKKRTPAAEVRNGR